MVSDKTYIWDCLFIDLILFLLFLLIYSLRNVLNVKCPFSECIKYFAISMGFTNIGLIMGILTGLSDSPVVGAIVPAFLTFFAALLGYWTLKEVSSQATTIAVIILLVVPLSLMRGVEIGMKDRITYHENQNETLINSSEVPDSTNVH